MTVLFKLDDSTGTATVAKIMAALDHHGYATERTFKSSSRPALASVYSIPGARGVDLDAIRKALAPFDDLVEYIEEGPDRRLKAG